MDDPPRCSGRRLERLVLSQDRLLEALQVFARLDPQLVDEEAAARAVDLERFGLTARAVERKHQVAAKAFPKRLA